MIFITGDVHNELPNSHPGGGIDEVAAALKYCRIAEEEGVKATLFLTGKAVREQPKACGALARRENVELAGHGWDSFSNPKLRTIRWALTGSRYGLACLQAMEIRNTIKAFTDCCGVRPKSWRHHAYYTDEYSYSLLRQEGIQVVSDRVTCAPFEGRSWAHAGILQLDGDLWSVPINTYPDHDTVIHGGITQEVMDSAVARWRERYRRRSGQLNVRFRAGLVAFVRSASSRVYDIRVEDWSGEKLYADGGPRMMSDRSWEGVLKDQIEQQVADHGFATVLLHPACMEILDGMKLVRSIMKYCAKFRTEFLGSVPEFMRGRVHGMDQM